MTFVVETEKPEGKYSELPALEQLVLMGYEYKTQSQVNNERKKKNQALLYDRLQEAVARINNLTLEEAKQAVDKIHEDNFRHEANLVDTNEKIHAKLTGLSTSSLEPITITQYDENGPYEKTVKLFDFENIENNDFVVTNQFEFWGFKKKIFPDIVIFVNGIPLVIIECKSPFRRDWLEAAVEKENYKKYRSRENGFERLMFYNFVLVAAAGSFAKYGTITSDANHFSKWSSAYPLTADQVEEKFGKSREQEVLLAGILDKNNLLNLLKNYVIYQTIEGTKVKIVAKHQQYRAVTKCVERLEQADSRYGGVVWHTQGSGKSFTMQWLAKQAITHGNMPIVIVTDRRQLDKQIYKNFAASGFPQPQNADTSDKLENFIKNPKGKSIMTTIQKFPEISSATDQKVLVLVDEAHRTQYGKDANAMSKALPNSIFFAFTGTPIDKKDKSTYQVFGPMVDKYGFEESKADGATLEIRYIGRMARLYVEGDETIDELFDRVIGKDPEIDSERKAELKKQYARKSDIAEAPERIKKIALDITKHYAENIEPDGYKAMVVAPSREAAVLYKKEFERINAPQSKIIMDQTLGETGKDGTSWDEYYLTDAEKRAAEESFKRRDDPTKIFIVVDMLLVGFDAPIVKVLYLDKGLKEHNLLQAIARVNRPYDEWKQHGLIVDYYGITKEIQKALEVFDDEDIKGAWEPDDEQLIILKQRYLDAISFVKEINKDNIDSEKVFEVFEFEDTRDKFEESYKQFAKVMSTQMHKKEAAPYIDDFKFLSNVRKLMRNKYDPPGMSLRPYAPRIQKLIDDAIRTSGIAEIVKPMEITFENFLVYLGKIKSPRARTALIKNKATQVIQENYEKNPAYYEKLWLILQKIIAEEEARRKKNAEIFDMEGQYREVYEKGLKEYEERKKLGFESPIEFAIYEELTNHASKEDSKQIALDLPKKILEETSVVGWKNKKSVELKITEIIYDELTEKNISDEKIPDITEHIISWVKNNL
jgi:type I restriction enzyme R subunit